MLTRPEVCQGQDHKLNAKAKAKTKAGHSQGQGLTFLAVSMYGKTLLFIAKRRRTIWRHAGALYTESTWQMTPVSLDLYDIAEKVR